MKPEHTTTLRVRYDECDPMGLVHHSNYLRYFEIARTELFRASGGNYRDFEASGLFVVVVRIDCRYKLPARYDDELAIRVKIERITEAKIEQSYRVEREASLLVTAMVTLAVIDRSGKLQRIPSSLRDPGAN
jgi:acyl-CoA thioester hydrolase